MLRRLLPLQTRGYHLVSAGVIIAAGNRVILLNEDQSLSPHSSILIEFFNFGMHDIWGSYHSLCRKYLPALSHIANLLRHTRKNFTFTHLYPFFWKCKGTFNKEKEKVNFCEYELASMSHCHNWRTFVPNPTRNSPADGENFLYHSG